MRAKAIDTIRRYNMLSYGDSVVIGLSGGADSCSLLHLLVSMRDEWDIKLFACHINHNLRGEEADRDEAFVRRLCDETGVKLYCLSVDVAAEAAKRHESTEKVGRDIRYAFFEEIADRYGAKIATAHTASDNAETVLFNMTRGSGVKGLSGIPPVRGRIIRPLIAVTREEIEDYCKANNFNFVTDSTNLTTEYTRNKLRLEVIPVLKGINPSFETGMTRMTEIMRSASELITRLADNALKESEVSGGYLSKKLSELDDTVFSECVFRLCGEYDIVPEAKQIALVRNIVLNGGAVELRGGVYAVNKQGIFRISRSAENEELFVPFSYDLSLDCGGRRLSVSGGKGSSAKNTLDGDKIPETAVFRHRKSGDSFRLPRRNITKSLKKLFNELKIPDEKRNSLIILADGSNVLWIEGVGASADCLAEKTSANILIISVD